MSGSNLHRSWEISTVPAEQCGLDGEGASHHAATHAVEKSDMPILSKKQPNKGQPAEAVEGRGVAEGNAFDSPADRTQSRETASMGLEGIQEAAKKDV